jgi:hypothetical protein
MGKIYITLIQLLKKLPEGANGHKLIKIADISET